MRKEDEHFMRLALKLAEKGRGKTSPNPMVGAVVVKGNRILAQGFHHKFGGPHAEAVALKKCGDQTKGATLYVNLEPCCHYGKTPPCTDLIIQSGIKKVVCSAIDPNPQVNGKGIGKLKKEGVEIDVGILEHEAKKLNEVYLKHVTTGLPFVMLKVAQTLDGRITDQTQLSGNKRKGIFAEFIKSGLPWIDAVLWDASTIEVDYINTLLESTGSRPKLILLGAKHEIESRLRKLKKDAFNNVVIVPTDHGIIQNGEQSHFKIWRVKKRKNGEIDLGSLLKKAGEEGITTLLVEGGIQIATSLLKQKLVDKIWYLISPDIKGKGEEPFGDLGIRKISDAVVLKECEFAQFRNNLVCIGYPS